MLCDSTHGCIRVCVCVVCVCVWERDRLLLNCAHKTLPTCEGWLWSCWCCHGFKTSLTCESQPALNHSASCPVVRLSAPGSSDPEIARLSRISLIPSASRRAPAAGLTGPLPAGGWHNCCLLTCVCGRAEVKPLRCSVRPDAYCVIMHL